jgi:hypothetical protein
MEEGVRALPAGPIADIGTELSCVLYKVV